MNPIRLVLDGQTLPSREVAELVEDMARRFGLDSRQAYRLRLAADEITTNIVLHGYRRAGGPINVQGDADGERVWLRIEDEAPPFDPDTRACRPPPPADQARVGSCCPAAADWSDAGAGGFGLFLARTSLDEFGYERAAGRNRYTLVVRPRTGGADDEPGTRGTEAKERVRVPRPTCRGGGAGDGRDRIGRR